jgi:Mg2+ and Co2+ transporter CorA
MSYNPIHSQKLRQFSENIAIDVMRIPRNGRVEEIPIQQLSELERYKDPEALTWIQIGGVQKEAIEYLANLFQIHFLIKEDILSLGQQAKLDEIGSFLYFLLPMNRSTSNIHYNKPEQLSLLLSKNLVISITDAPKQDVFDVIRDRIREQVGRFHQAGEDFLL